MNGADALAATLKVQGVEWMATLCGNGLNGIFAACGRAGIRLIDTRNEQTASYMAECWGRLSGQVGVCAVSSGVAHVNALTGVLNAHFDGAPMLLLTGAGPLSTTGMGHFQDLDHVALAAPVCKYARVLDTPERIPAMVREALGVALCGRPGPVHLTVPMDIQAAEVQVEIPAAPVASPGRRPASADSIERAGELLAAASRPLLVAGNGAYYAGAGRALGDFAAAFGIPVVVPIWDRGCLWEPHAEFLGVIGAATGGPRLVEDADLLVLLGAAADYRLGYLQPPTVAAECRVIRVDVDDGRLQAGPPPDLAIPADPSAALEQLHDECAKRQLDGFEPWLAEARGRCDRFMAAVTTAVDRSKGLHALDLVEAIAEVMPPTAVLVVDGGNVGQWFHQTLGRSRYSGLVLTCGASGVVGFGIAGAMAARAGFPGRPVVLLSGDGAATFNIADLERAASQDLPFAMIVADDESWGIVAEGHRRQYGELLNSGLGSVDFAAVAGGLGALGTRVDDRESLVAALHRALSEPTPVVIHAPVQGGGPAQPL